jgi:hypothetical protein
MAPPPDTAVITIPLWAADEEADALAGAPPAAEPVACGGVLVLLLALLPQAAASSAAARPSPSRTVTGTRAPASLPIIIVSRSAGGRNHLRRSCRHGRRVSP